MKKVREIRSAEPVIQPAIPAPLSDVDSTTLKALATEREKVNNAIGALVGRVLASRGLSPADWALSLTDCRSIIPNPNKPASTAPPASS